MLNIYYKYIINKFYKLILKNIINNVIIIFIRKC